jgi:N-ethylmaleimide reductase
MTTLFDPLTLGAATLPNRIVMAPMTRSRSTQPSDVPNAMMAEYYAQRASTGRSDPDFAAGQSYSFSPGFTRPNRLPVGSWSLMLSTRRADVSSCDFGM